MEAMKIYLHFWQTDCSVCIEIGREELLFVKNDQEDWRKVLSELTCWDSRIGNNTGPFS
jgi:hypothetical protein